MSILSASDLESVAKTAIDDMKYNLAIHLLETLRDDYSDEYEYNVDMGTLETPQPIKAKRMTAYKPDSVDDIEEDEDDYDF